ncbi:MAG: glycosyltransferase family 2 protein [Sellimonas intestinalis]
MEENKIKVSVIMPVYKVEEYVGKAIESIQAQTLKDWEFLIVDDGTPDKSGEICDAYAAEDERIHVIHKENGGAPSARNTAIEIAKGEIHVFHGFRRLGGTDDAGRYVQACKAGQRAARGGRFLH